MNVVAHKIEEVFSIFRDSEISTCSGDLAKLQIRIGCEHLADLRNPGDTHFYVELSDVSLLEFDPWMKPSDAPKRIFKHHVEFLNAKMDIINAKVARDLVVVACDQIEEERDYEGGNLRIVARNVRVLDQDKAEISLFDLDALSRKYWSLVDKEDSAHPFQTVGKWILIILFFPISLLFVAYFKQKKGKKEYGRKR